jgi:hypothetical protein
MVLHFDTTLTPHNFGRAMTATARTPMLTPMVRGSAAAPNLDLDHNWPSREGVHFDDTGADQRLDEAGKPGPLDDERDRRRYASHD